MSPRQTRCGGSKGAGNEISRALRGLTLVNADVLRFDIVHRENGERYERTIPQTIFSFAQTEALEAEKEA